MRHRLFFPILSSLAVPALAVDTQPAAPAGPWSHDARVAVQFTNVQAVQADESTDPTIAGSQDSVTYLMRFEGKLTWKADPQSLEQQLKMIYGRSRTEGDEWVESNDEITYDLTHLWKLRGALNWYNAGGLRSVFTGPEPETDFADPTLTKVSTGLREVWERGGPNPWKLQTGGGLRVQRWFGGSASDDQREWKIGLEWLGKIEQKVGDHLKYHAEYEGFSPFDDMAHITHLLTGGLTYAFNAFLSLDADLRAWYEHEPKDAPDGASGYDTLSYRHQVVFGLSYTF